MLSKYMLYFVYFSVRFTMSINSAASFKII